MRNSWLQRQPRFRLTFFFLLKERNRFYIFLFSRRSNPHAFNNFPDHTSLWPSVWSTGTKRLSWPYDIFVSWRNSWVPSQRSWEWGTNSSVLREVMAITINDVPALLSWESNPSSDSKFPTFLQTQFLWWQWVPYTPHSLLKTLICFPCKRKKERLPS